MISTEDHQRINVILEQAVAKARNNTTGQVATYIPELAHAPLEATSAAITLCDGKNFAAGNNISHRFTLQSVAKLILLAGLLEEFGEKAVFNWVGAESSGHDFSNIVQIESFGPKPSNPCVNAGAIVLCNYIPEKTIAKQIKWLDRWIQKLFNEPLKINQAVFKSEASTGYRNIALANLLKSNNVITREVNDVLHVYFNLCSYEATITQAANFAAILANGGINAKGVKVLSKRTVQCVVSIMATCGLYNESGQHLLHTGFPAKSGVSGIIIAVAVGLGGIAVFSPRINAQGGSVRGHIMLEYLSTKLGWHFATV